MSQFVPELIRLLRENPSKALVLCYEEDAGTILVLSTEVPFESSPDAQFERLSADRLDRSRYPHDVLLQSIEDLLCPQEEDEDGNDED